MAKIETKQDKQAKSGKKKPTPKKKKKEVEVVPVPDGYVARLYTKYHEDVVPALIKKFDYKNVMQVPHMSHVVLNVGLGDAANEQRLLESVVDELETITGQKAVITRARKSISNFKLREGMPVGVRVTLRRSQMWEFMDKFFSLAMPRVRDFRGLSDKSFDGHGNYSTGIKEQIVFPEIDYDKVVKIHGMDVTFVTTAANDEEGRELLQLLGCPFRKKTPVAGEEQPA